MTEHPAGKSVGVLVTGSGRLSRALQRQPWPEGFVPVFMGRSQLDIVTGDIDAVLARHAIKLIINTAAWTDVDAAEGEPKGARRVNVDGAARLAEAATRRGAAMLQVSTDYVFGQGTGPWGEGDEPGPLNVYGVTKLAGEKAVLRANPLAVVVRTSWLFDSQSSNFLTTMLSLSDRAEIGVIGDQQGSPTSTDDLAAGLLQLAGAKIDGAARVLHFANAGGATRLEFARAIFERAAAHGLMTPALKPTLAADWPAAAIRPSDSRLSIEGWTDMGLPTPRRWREAVNDAVDQWIANRGASS